MKDAKSEFLARTIRAIDSGDAQAASELVPFLYGELRQPAGALLKRSAATLRDTPRRART